MNKLHYVMTGGEQGQQPKTGWILGDCIHYSDFEAAPIRECMSKGTYITPTGDDCKGFTTNCKKFFLLANDGMMVLRSYLKEYEKKLCLTYPYTEHREQLEAFKA